METIAYGYLLGIGIVMALMTLAIIIAVVVLVGMWFNYMGEKTRQRQRDSVRSAMDDEDHIV